MMYACCKKTLEHQRGGKEGIESIQKKEKSPNKQHLDQWFLEDCTF